MAGETMPKHDHHKAAEHHEEAAKSHRKAADAHEKGEHADATQHSQMAHDHSTKDQMGPEQIRAYQVYLINERKLNARTVGHHTAALRFFYYKTLKRAYPIEEVPYPKAPRRLPTILTQEEAVRLIDAASNLFHRAMLMTVYSTGMRRAEMCRLKVEDIDSDRMLIHIRQGKGRGSPSPIIGSSHSMANASLFVGRTMLTVASSAR
jgi:site-specific recombinase XerD